MSTATSFFNKNNASFVVNNNNSKKINKYILTIFKKNNKLYKNKDKKFISYHFFKYNYDV